MFLFLCLILGCLKIWIILDCKGVFDVNLDVCFLSKFLIEWEILLEDFESFLLFFFKMLVVLVWLDFDEDVFLNIGWEFWLLFLE